jgi:hypothetical protein
MNAEDVARQENCISQSKHSILLDINDIYLYERVTPGNLTAFLDLIVMPDENKNGAANMAAPWNVAP